MEHHARTARQTAIRSSGFTLIETLVAVSILTLAIAGPMLTASDALKAANLAKDQLVASGLAQEGIEFVRRVRDDEYLAEYSTCSGSGCGTVSQDAWQGFLHGSGANPSANVASCRNGNACTVDPWTGTMSAIIKPLNLYVDNSGDVEYTQQNLGKPTIFTRTVDVNDVSGQTFDAVSDPAEVQVASTVTWQFHGSTYHVTIYDHLTPWQ